MKAMKYVPRMGKRERRGACYALLLVGCLVPLTGFVSKQIPGSQSPLQLLSFGAGVSYIDRNYYRVLRTRGDINEHLPTIQKLARECGSAAELGVRGVVSTFALLRGLRDSKIQGGKHLVCVDLDPMYAFQTLVPRAAAEGVEVIAAQADSATYHLPFPVDLLFIDTWHVYGHLKRELAQHSGQVLKYIVLHDTEIDGKAGESLRNQRSDLPWMDIDIQAQADRWDLPLQDVTRGLQPAIDEFLAAHKGEWVLHRHYRHNNGLTVLRRVKPTDKQIPVV